MKVRTIFLVMTERAGGAEGGAARHAHKRFHAWVQTTGSRCCNVRIPDMVLLLVIRDRKGNLKTNQGHGLALILDQIPTKMKIKQVHILWNWTKYPPKWNSNMYNVHCNVHILLL